MDSKRRARLSSVILRESVQLLRREVKDPRLLGVSLTRVELTPDAGAATLFYLNDLSEHDGREIKEGLRQLQPWMRRQLGAVLELRTVPEISFKEDRGLENTRRVAELLRQIKDEAPVPVQETEDSSTK